MQGPIFRGRNIADMLLEARDYVLRTGRLHETQRGYTRSAGCVTLIWEEPDDLVDSPGLWDRTAVDCYQSIFVDKRPENAPERLAVPGQLLFPYTYAARSRYWDGGWGYVVGAIRATKAVNGAVDELLADADSFLAYLAAAGELLHLQPLLAVWDWLGYAGMRDLLADPGKAQFLLERTRIDQLDRITRDIDQNPGSRRAITASFVYPVIDHRFDRLLGVPPYQTFQLLPAADRAEPLHSFHVHRSLDAGNGVQLDFNHDLCWLRHVTQQLDRPLGTIAIVAGDFHVYVETEEQSDRAALCTSLDQWLAKVTDGYRAGQGEAGRRLRSDPYRSNALRVYERLKQEAGK